MRDASIDELDFASSVDQEASVTAPEDAPAAAATGPVIQVLKGNPSDAEIGALVAVLSAAAASGSDEPGSGLPVDNWGSPASMHRTAAPSSPYGYRHVARTRG